MADQALAQAGALGQGSAPRPLAKRAWTAGVLWSRYVFRGRHRGVAGLVDLLPNNYFIRAAQVPAEFAALGDALAELRPTCALEIGTAKGGTLFMLTRLASADALILSVDLPHGKYGGGYGSLRKLVYQRFARRWQRLHLLQGDSHSERMFERVKQVLGRRTLDYLFIDGDHTYQGVRQDFEMYSPLVRRGGLIAFHDIAEHPPEAECQVRQFWQEVKTRFRHSEYTGEIEQGWAGIGVLHVD